MVLCERTPAAPEEAATLIRAEAGKLLTASDVAEVAVTELRTADRSQPRAGDWLIEVSLEPEADPDRLIEHAAFVDFLAELRSLQVCPVAALADPADRVTFSPAER